MLNIKSDNLEANDIIFVVTRYRVLVCLRFVDGQHGIARSCLGLIVTDSNFIRLCCQIQPNENANTDILKKITGMIKK